MNACSKSSKLRLPADSESRLDAEFNEAICRGVFSGASILISGGPKPDFFERTWGSVESSGDPVTFSTRFDLASLTKPLVTAPLCMIAAERGLVNLDDPVSRFFPTPADKKGITIRNLLSHSSGLPAYERLYPELIKLPPEARRDALASMILETPLDSAPGRRANYSDLGFILLGLIVERQMAGRLDRLARDFLFDPLEIDELHFCPVEKTGAESLVAAPPRRRVPGSVTYAATENCPWRKRLLFGEVDDKNAWILNGVSGQAGLFGTARGIFKLLCFLWNIYEGNIMDTSPFERIPASVCPPPKAAGSPATAPRRPLWRRETVRLFWTRTEVAEGTSDWCLGFDTPSRKGYSSTGRYFSDDTVGHLGFTGVSFWLDLKKRVLVILLTNRVYPTRQNDGIRQLRPVLHDLIMEALAAEGGR